MKNIFILLLLPIFAQGQNVYQVTNCKDTAAIKIPAGYEIGRTYSTKDTIKATLLCSEDDKIWVEEGWVVRPFMDYMPNIYLDSRKRVLKCIVWGAR